jgi:hypothetical protein
LNVRGFDIYGIQIGYKNNNTNRTKKKLKDGIPELEEEIGALGKSDIYNKIQL